MSIPFNKTSWLREGFVIQSPQKQFILGLGPFTKSAKARPNSLYHPDFFLDTKKPWLCPSQTIAADQKTFSEFLLGQEEAWPKARLKNNLSSQALAQGGLAPSGAFCKMGFKPSGLGGFLSQDKARFGDKVLLKSFQQAGSGQRAIESFFRPSKKPSFIQYQSLFAQAQQAFRQGHLQKVVPCLREELGLRPPLLWLLQRLFKSACDRPNGFFYGAWGQKAGILGLSPELLLSIKGREFEAHALAGTGLCPGPSLLKNAKELKEHDFVVKGLQTALAGQVEGLRLLRDEIPFFPLKHLRTRLLGRLTKNRDFIALCQALHPTPALSGWPHIAALKWLKNSPSQRDRGFFGAPFGFFRSQREAFCVIAIRALEWSAQSSWIRSGGGLIAQSLLQKEWRELALKREQVKRFFSPSA